MYDDLDIIDEPINSSEYSLEEFEELKRLEEKYNARIMSEKEYNNIKS